MKLESDVQKEVMLALYQSGCTVWRNNTGAYKDGSRYIRYGLCVGSSDIIGIAPNGVFIAIEIKTQKGKLMKEQINFIEAVNRAGGCAFVARSPEDALMELEKCKNR